MSFNEEATSPTSNTTTSQVPTQSTGSIVSLYSHDSGSIQITTHKLEGKNYLEWAQSVKIVICGRGKLGYITGDLPTPSLDDSTYKVWQAENSIVLAWLINSMDPKVSRRYLFFKTAKEVWDAARKMYSDLGNTSQKFEIQTKLKEIKQGTQTVTQYFLALQDLWQELDLYLETTPLCSACSIIHRKNLEKERVYEFLTWLTHHLDEVRGRIISRSPLPDTEEAFSEVHREEARRRVMLYTSDSQPLEGSALAARSGSREKFNPDPRPNRKGERPWCDHCKRHGHTRSTRWEIHGKPANWTPRRSNDKKAYQTQTQGNEGTSSDISQGTTSFPFSKEQIAHLYTLMNQSDPHNSGGSNTASCSVAHSGNFSSNIENCQTPWIIDLGASDHMTCLFHLFDSYSSCSNNSSVKIADGTLSPIAGIGTITLTNYLSLKSVLHVPSLNFNLISVSKFTTDNSCLAKFSSSSCQFQELSSGRMIGSARFHGGLYFFEDRRRITQPSSLFSAYVSTFNHVSNKDKIMLWHYRLGHPNFSYLKHVFPNLFLNNKIESFQCDICQFAKHTRSVFPQKIYTPTSPFSLIHSDLWGPSKVTTVNGHQWFITFIDDHTRLTWVYLLKHNSETHNVFRTFHMMIQTQFQASIRILRTDNGTEYFNSVLGPYLSQNGIIHQSSCVDTPQQNGVAERKIATS